MFKFATVCSGMALVVVAASTTSLHADVHDQTLVVTMTNDPDENKITVFDAETHALLQTLPTYGKGGVGNNARGVRQHDGQLFAAVNNGSNSVAVYRRDGFGLKFDRLVSTTSAPVSIDFGNDHMYVAGATSIDSFVLHENSVQQLDGSTPLALAGGETPPVGSTAQVGVLNARQVLVTLKADPDPGTVDVIGLQNGAVTPDAPTAISGPTGSLTPFGFSVNDDGTALITLAHSAQDGLFRAGSFVSVIGAGQFGPCWTTRVDKYVFTANTGSGSISRLISTGANIFVDSLVAASVVTGAPLDLDAAGGILGLIDHGAGQSHLSLFAYNKFGELTPAGPPITIAVKDANGVAVMPGR